MPLSHSISPKDRIAHVTATGSMNVDTVIETFLRIIADPAFGSGYGILADARATDVKDSALSVTDVRRLVSTVVARMKPIQVRVAFVVGSERLRSLAPIVDAFAEIEGYPLKAFTDIKSAAHWVAGRA